VDVSKGPALERIARVLAGRHLSANALGSEQSASAEVDASWRDHRDDAIAILKTLREPDAAMAVAGDAAVWERMIAAALGTTLPDRPAASATAKEPPPEPGTDPFNEGP
jgi:hypothetical protein